MIKPEELRIGNFVEAPNDTYIDRIDKIKDYCFKVCVVSKGIVKINIGFDAQRRFEENPVYSYGFEDLKPIPITKEWLVMFGFGQSDETEMGHNAHDEFGFYYDYDENGILLLDSGAQYHRMEYIRHVHQLQNLYFSLTGEELEITK